MFLWEAFSALEVLRSSFVLKTLAEVEEVAGKPREDRDLMEVSVHALEFQPPPRSMRQKTPKKRLCRTNILSLPPCQTLWCDYTWEWLKIILRVCWNSPVDKMSRYSWVLKNDHLTAMFKRMYCGSSINFKIVSIWQQDRGGSGEECGKCVVGIN